MFYNVWWNSGEMWTARSLRGVQDWRNPPGLSKEDAESLCRILNRYGNYSVRPLNYKPEVIIGIPMDPTMHPLMAGHLQDRARKRA